MKTLSVKDLKDIANVLRRDSIKATNSAGSGHPTSCMSSAEIMSVLFFYEMSYDVKNPDNPNNDEFILSKGHAAPILYSVLKRSGCINEDLNTLRKLSSPLEGHPMPRSLDWIKVATGSLGQGLSVGWGMALASRMKNKKSRTFVLLGDSESSEGSVWEALQLAGYYETNNLVAVFDINRLGETTETMLGHDVKTYKKRIKSFGWNVEVVNGHNVKELSRAFEKSKKSKKPTAVVAKTLKGKGYSKVENKEGRHGKSLSDEEMEKALKEIPDVEMPQVEIKKPQKELPKDRKIKIPLLSKYGDEKFATRDGFGRGLRNLARFNKNIVSVDAELSDSTRAEKLREVSKNYVECFIAEQNAVGVALGLSKKGFNVFSSTFATFFTRAHDQVRMAAHSSADISFVGSHGGVSVGEDGVSQMGMEDLALFRSLSNSTVFYPSDAVSAEKLTYLVSGLNGIKYIRTTRPKTPVIYGKNDSFKVGGFKTFGKNTRNKAVVMGAGVTFHEALKAQKDLKKDGKDVAVIDLYCIKPLDAKKLISFIEKNGSKVIVVEDHFYGGGMGEAVGSEIAKSGKKIKFSHLAVKGIPHSGDGQELLKEYGVDSGAIVKEVLKMI